MRSDLLTDLDTMAFRSNSPVDAARVLTILEALTVDGEPIEALVQRYARSSEVAIHLALSYLLSKTASRGPARTQLPALVWTMVERMPHPDDAIGINLLNAIQLLAAYDVVSDLDARASEFLSSFLLDSLTGSAAVQAIAISAIGQLDANGLLSRLGPDVRDALRFRLSALAASCDDIVRMELPAVAGFIGSTPSE